MLKTISQVLLFNFLFLLSLHGFSENNTPDTDKKWTVCTDPRPQVCSREYRPVCTKLKAGSHKTYANGCTACSDPKVVSYTPGKCSGDK